MLRCLFEVMTKGKTGNDVSITALPGVRTRKSHLYSQDNNDPRWREPLNRHVMHASPRRTTPSNEIDGNHLNTMVVDLALEVLHLWRSVESDIGSSELGRLLIEVRQNAIDDAANDARRHGAQPVFTMDSGATPGP